MKVIGAASGIRTNEARVDRSLPLSHRTIGDLALYLIYPLALAVSISVWFIAIRAPLWIDETGSYWQISGGFWEIWPREIQSISFPAYSYILWLSTKIIGTSEIALRIPSILAMLGAVYLLYLAARELFERDIAFIAAVIFCLHQIVVFASIDVRPYAFGALATNAAIFILLRLRRSDSNWLAALFGLSASCIVWFQFLFIDILPALALCYFAIKECDRKTLWRQFGVAFVAFALAFVPVIPSLQYLFRTGKNHVVETAPNLLSLLMTLAPGWLLPIFCGAGFVAFLFRAAKLRGDSPKRFERWQLFFCASLALIPILLLYGVSVGTSLPMFADRHRLDAIPGIALFWAFLLSCFPFRTLRLVFCITLVTVTACILFGSSLEKHHANTWKYALEVVERNASADNSPVLMCSGFIESDYETMPLGAAKDSNLFAQLSYYKLSVPVVPLPLTLNDEAARVSSSFLQKAARNHERFLALGDKPSYKILDWLAQHAAATHSVQKLGVFDRIEVLEFVPRT